jgi:hypothetical protein
MEAFVLNSQGRLVFPENFWPDLDFTVFETLPQFETVIRRDFEAKAPTGADILSRVESNGYGDRHELLRDLTLNLMWVNRYAMTMYEKRPMRWRDVPRHRDDVFLPVLTPWEDGELKINAVRTPTGRCRPRGTPRRRTGSSSSSFMSSGTGSTMPLSCPRSSRR